MHAQQLIAVQDVERADVGICISWDPDGYVVVLAGAYGDVSKGVRE